MPSELDCWMEWIDNQMADEVHEPLAADDFEEFVGGKLNSTYDIFILFTQICLRVIVKQCIVMFLLIL